MPFEVPIKASFSSKKTNIFKSKLLHPQPNTKDPTFRQPIHAFVARSTYSNSKKKETELGNGTEYYVSHATPIHQENDDQILTKTVGKSESKIVTINKIQQPNQQNPSLTLSHSDDKAFEYLEYINSQLFIALEAGDVASIETFLSSPGINPNTKNHRGQTLIQRAMQKGDTVISKMLLKHSDIILDRDPKGWHPIHWAVKWQDLRLVAQIISRFPESLNQPGPQGWTPLHLAIHLRSYELVKLLISHSAIDTNLCAEGDMSPLHLCMNLPEETHSSGMASLFFDKGSSDSIGDVHLGMAELLVKHDATIVDEVDRNGRLPLHWAVQEHALSLVEFLLEKAPHTANIPDKRGDTPLHKATWCHGHQGVQTVRYLLSCGVVDVNAVNKHGQTPLHVALENRLTLDKIVSLLLDHPKIDMTLLDHKARHVIHFAAQSDRTQIIKQIVEKDPKSLDMADEYGNTALHLAAKRGNVGAVMLLCELGADVSKTNKVGQTAYNAALAGENYQSAEYLRQESFKQMVIKGKS
jgi:ankyrin repeat protein